jgi:hypothetical protein
VERRPMIESAENMLGRWICGDVESMLSGRRKVYAQLRRHDVESVAIKGYIV